MQLRNIVGADTWAAGNYAVAAFIFKRLSTASRLDDFLTLPLYEVLASKDGGSPVARM